jgi:transposase InsO family protein
MNAEVREQVALARFKLISPVLAEPAREQNEYFRTLAEKPHMFPHYGPRRFAPSTFKAWLATYRKDGFEALKPKIRADRGRPRRLSGAQLERIRIQCKAYPNLSVIKLHEKLSAEGQLGDPPICYSNLIRIIRNENLLPKTKRNDVRKRYETENVNDLWVCDFMHGPAVRADRRRQKAILCAIIDDHSRMIVGHGFAAGENVSALTVVLKDALSAFGLPRRFYVDNGPSFSSDLLAKACAQAHISLTHSKPYDSPSRGKIERFFRTVRQRFLDTIGDDISLGELNQAFSSWLQEDYHHKQHKGIDARPIDRYHASVAKADIRRKSKAELNEIFLVRHERVVNNDATISFKGNIYEVPAAYIRQRIELRHPVDEPTQLWLYDNAVRVGALKLVDTKENARIFRPTKTKSALSFAKERVRT